MIDYEIAWDCDVEDLRLTTAGAPTVAELNAMSDAALADPRFRPGLKILIDHRASNLSGLTHDEVRARAEWFVSRARQLGAARIAYVAVKPVNYGIERMIEVLASDGRGYEIAVFYDEEEARTWLQG